MKKLDLKTRIYLHLINVQVVEHEKVEDTKEKKELIELGTDANDIFIFENYEEYKKYFLMFVDNIDNDMINLAIFAIGSKGHILAVKKICNNIITWQRFREINSFQSNNSQKLTLKK